MIGLAAVATPVATAIASTIASAIASGTTVAATTDVAAASVGSLIAGSILAANAGSGAVTGFRVANSVANSVTARRVIVVHLAALAASRRILDLFAFPDLDLIALLLLQSTCLGAVGALSRILYSDLLACLHTNLDLLLLLYLGRDAFRGTVGRCYCSRRGYRESRR